MLLNGRSVIRCSTAGYRSMEHAEQEPASVGVDREPSPDAAESPWLALLKPARVKMELAAPVYGHGFGPPPVALDLSRPPALDAVAYVRQTTPPFTPGDFFAPFPRTVDISRDPIRSGERPLLIHIPSSVPRSPSLNKTNEKEKRRQSFPLYRMLNRRV